LIGCGIWLLVKAQKARELFTAIIRSTMAYGAGIWHQPALQPKGLAIDLAPRQSKCLRIALGAYRATPVRSLETGLNVPSIDLYLTSVKAAFEKWLDVTPRRDT